MGLFPPQSDGKIEKILLKNFKLVDHYSHKRWLSFLFQKGREKYITGQVQKKDKRNVPQEVSKKDEGIIPSVFIRVLLSSHMASSTPTP